MPALWVVVSTHGDQGKLVEQLSRLEAATPSFQRGSVEVVLADVSPEPLGWLAARHGVRHVRYAGEGAPLLARHAAIVLSPRDAAIVEVDEGDWLEPRALRLVGRAFQSGAHLVLGDCVAAGGYMEAAGPDKVFRKGQYRPYRMRRDDSFHWGVRAYGRKLYDEVGGYCADEHEIDARGLLLRMEAALRGKGIVSIPRPLCHTVLGETATVTNRKFVFVGGLQRSATTVMAHCLSEHPLISGFRDTGAPADEGQFLQSTMPTGWDHGGPGRFAFDPRAHLTELSPMATVRSAMNVFLEWKSWWDLSKPFLLEKTPPSLLRTRLLQAMYADSYFIMLMRHPIPVSLATKRNWAHSLDIGTLVEHWLRSYDIFYADARFLRKCLLIRYEEFVSDPQGQLDGAYAFLGLDSHPNTVDIRDHNQKYFAQWEGWPGSKDTLIARFEDRVARYGYSLVDPYAAGSCHAALRGPANHDDLGPAS